MRSEVHKPVDDMPFIPEVLSRGLQCGGEMARRVMLQ